MTDELAGITVTSGEEALMRVLSGYSYDSDQGLNLYQTAKKLSDTEEFQLYGEYEQEFLDNDLAQFLVMNLVGQLMDFRLESEDPKALTTVENFMYSRDTEENLQQLLIHAFVFGTGMAQRFQVGNRLDNFVRIDAKTVEIEKLGRDAKGFIKYKYTQNEDTDDESAAGSGKVLKEKMISVFRPIEVPNSAYGLSMMRSSLLPLQAIRQLNMDIPAGIKKLAYETMVLSMDLEGVEKDKQQATVKQLLKSFVRYDSATASVIGLDNRHSLKYVGADGGSGQRLMPILDLVEPILIFLLNKWSVPLGDVLQEKSNRALSTTQTDSARRRLRTLKRKFARFVEREIIQRILSGKEDSEEPPVVRLVHNVAFADISDEADFFLRAAEAGMIPRETFIQKLGIHVADDATHYVMPNKATVSDGEIPEPEDEPGDDDNSEPQSNMNEDDSSDDDSDDSNN